MKSNQYDIVINQNQNWDDPNYLYEAARIIKKETGKKVISVFYCKNGYQIFKYHFGLIRLNENEIGIIHDDLYINLSNTDVNAFDAMLMHEVGHFLNGDLDKDRDDAEIRQERVIEILKGIVAPEELAADRFAVEHCGKNAVIRMLDTVIETRKRRQTADGLIALKELELRKQAVKRL